MAERGRPCGSVPSDERRGAPYSPASRRRSRRDRWLRRRSRERGCAASACSWEAQTTLGQTRSTPLMQGLGALNWHDGGNLHIDWRWAGGDPVLYERYAAELIAHWTKVAPCCPCVATLSDRVRGRSDMARLIGIAALKVESTKLDCSSAPLRAAPSRPGCVVRLRARWPDRGTELRRRTLLTLC